MEEIFNFFTRNGFKRDGDALTKTETRVVRQVIVNGERHDETAELEHKVVYLGEGYIEDSATGKRETTYGFKFITNNFDNGDLWVRDLRDLISFFKRN